MAEEDREKTAFITISDRRVRSVTRCCLLWSKECRGDLPASHDCALSWYDEQGNGGLCRWHDRQVLLGRNPAFWRKDRHREGAAFDKVNQSLFNPPRNQWTRSRLKGEEGLSFFKWNKTSNKGERLKGVVDHWHHLLIHVQLHQRKEKNLRRTLSTNNNKKKRANNIFDGTDLSIFNFFFFYSHPSSWLSTYYHSLTQILIAFVFAYRTA